MMTRPYVTMAVGLLSVATLQAAVPPDRINYQGVLRDTAGNPRNGSFDMIFRLFDQDVGGNEILLDRHLVADGNPVIVTDGLFNVEIGSGQMLDGSGAGTYTTLGEAFRDFGPLWLGIQIGPETLTPRLRLASAGYALNARSLAGKEASSFLDTGPSAQSKSGQLNLTGASAPPGQPALTASGAIGAEISSTDGTSVSLASDGNGVWSSGLETGGTFFGDGYGVQGFGTIAGALFQDIDNPSWAYLGYGGIGANVQGQYTGGAFQTPDNLSFATLANGNWGLVAKGAEFTTPDSLGLGGYFIVRNAANSTDLATASLAAATRNPSGIRYTRAGVFENLESGSRVELAAGGGAAEEGVWAESGSHFGFGGVFISGNWLALAGGGGIAAIGEDRGAYLEDTNSSGWANVGYNTYKIYGSGSVAFTQNHPTEKDRVIVYNAPEGDEVATYTRGSAQLVGGEARIRLGETFAWVTNPDLGLTAYVTPVGEWTDLYIASQSTKELVVRSRDPGASNVRFNYIVYGLRIGFEETSIVQEKRHDAFIPSMAEHRKLYADHPELRRFAALERVRTERDAMGLEAAQDLTASAALRDAIHEFDPAVDKRVDHGAHERVRPYAGTPGVMQPLAAPGDAEAPSGRPAPRGDVSRLDPATDARGIGRVEPAPAAVSPLQGVTVPMAAGEPVEPGDVLVFDPDRAATLRRGTASGDTGVAGVAAAPSTSSGASEGLVAVTIVGLVSCKVDAGYGAIHPGDLLTASPTAGHAMRTLDAAPGTILGKALDPLEAGTGTIRILVMPR